LLVVVGLFVWFGCLVDGVFFVVLFIVIGYLVNDMVVVFDCVCEYWVRLVCWLFVEVANDVVL